jgi:hypothetical protein
MHTFRNKRSHSTKVCSPNENITLKDHNSSESGLEYIEF